MDRQAADSLAAAANTWAELKRDLVKAGDVRPWIERYPWPAVGVALVAGFTAATVAARSASESTRREASKALPAASEAGEDKQPNQETPEARKGKQRVASVLWTAMINSLFEMAKTGLFQVLRTSVASTLENTAQQSQVVTSPAEAEPPVEGL